MDAQHYSFRYPEFCLVLFSTVGVFFFISQISYTNVQMYYLLLYFDKSAAHVAKQI